MPQSCNCCSDQVRCDDCYHWNLKTSSTRCQGAVPDLCASYLCDGCEVKCWGCNLVVCEQHCSKVDGHVQCDRCSLEIANSAVLDLAEALESMPAQFQAAVLELMVEVAEVA